MRYFSGRVGIVGVQWNVDSNVGEMRVVRGDGRCEDSIYGSGFVNGMTNNAFGNCDPLFGLRFEAARALWGYCSECVKGKCGKHFGRGKSRRGKLGMQDIQEVGGKRREVHR